MVAAPNQPQTIPLTEHLRIVREKDQKIHRLEKQLRFRTELDAVPSEIMSQAQKAALNAAVKVIGTDKPDINGRVLLKGTDDLAKSVGVSAKRFQKHLSYCDEIGVIQKETLPVRDEHGQILYTETYVKPTEHTFYPKEYEAEKTRNHGGDRLTCKCGSERIKKEIRYICMDCGEVHNTPPRYIHPQTQIGSTVNEQEREHETEENNPFEPEDQFGSTVESNQKTNLTLITNTINIQAQLDPTANDDSNNPPCSVSTPFDHDTVIKNWLGKRGDDFIYSTGSLKTEDKYLSKPKGYQPDLDAYLAGQLGHIYGSRLLNSEGLTSVLCFEIDRAEQDEQAENYLLDIARAGAAAVYWQRYANERRRGHLELYFDQAVDPEAAREWALEICPDLEEIPEVFPCDGIENRTKHALSWPLYQRIADKVYPCKAKYILPDPHTGELRECDPTDKQALASLVTLAVTPATLVEEFATVLEARAELQPREQGQESAHGGVIGIKPKPLTQVQSDKDLAKQVIADFNRLNRIEDMVEVNARGKFAAVWRGERTASVALDRDGEHATDHGMNGSFRKKLDAYEVYCLINNIDKKADLAERCAQLRRAEIKVVKSEDPPVELFPVEQQRAVHAICVVCSKPKSVRRADGAMTCGTDHVG